MPLKPGLSAEELLGLMAGQNLDGQGLVQATWREVWGEGFEERWARSLEDGVVENSASPSVDVAIRTDWDAGTCRSGAVGRPRCRCSRPIPRSGTARYANNGWLQELPKPLTKQVWGNAALIAPETAAIFGLSSGDAVDLTVEGRDPARACLAHARPCAGGRDLPLGYGRLQAGRIGNGIGFDAYAIRPSQRPWVAAGEIKAAGRAHPARDDAAAPFDAGPRHRARRGAGPEPCQPDSGQPVALSGLAL